MDASRFDTLVRSLASRSSRRGVLPRLTATALGLGGGGHVPALSSAKKRRKKVKRNAFGCVNVGRFCKHDNQCCSGICKGKKGKKRCKAHNTGGCQAGQQRSVCGGTTVTCTTSSGQGVCDTTTGKAGYCLESAVCFACSKDAECRPVCGPAAACVRCEVACVAFGGTSCVGPSPGMCIPPP